jgi:hypothetical protein
MLPMLSLHAYALAHLAEIRLMLTSRDIEHHYCKSAYTGLP